MAFHRFCTPILLVESVISGFDSSFCQVDSSPREFVSSSCQFDSSFYEFDSSLTTSVRRRLSFCLVVAEGGFWRNRCFLRNRCFGCGRFLMLRFFCEIDVLGVVDF